jgi:hypothetical protein
MSTLLATANELLSAITTGILGLHWLISGLRDFIASFAANWNRANPNCAAAVLLLTVRVVAREP